MTITSFTVTVRHPHRMKLSSVKEMVKTAVMSEKGHYSPEDPESEVEFVDIKTQRKSNPK